MVSLEKTWTWTQITPMWTMGSSTLDNPPLSFSRPLHVFENSFDLITSWSRAKSKASSLKTALISTVLRQVRVLSPGEPWARRITGVCWGADCQPHEIDHSVVCLVD